MEAEKQSSKFAGLHDLIVRYASDIRAGKCSSFVLAQIVTDIDRLPQTEKDNYADRIAKIKKAAADVDSMVRHDTKGRVYSRILWGWILTREEINIISFSLEWWIHERINEEILLKRMKEEKAEIG